jgi:hypothetical protein
MKTCDRLPQPRMSNAAWRRFLARHPGWRAPLRPTCSLATVSRRTRHAAASRAVGTTPVPAPGPLRRAGLAAGGAAATLGAGAAAFAAGDWLGGLSGGGGAIGGGSGGGGSGGLGSGPGPGGGGVTSALVGATTVPSVVPVPEPSGVLILVLPLALLVLLAGCRRGARRP